jgi:queuine/archaeosine tRNA-ribosyltransferase
MDEGKKYEGKNRDPLPFVRSSFHSSFRPSPTVPFTLQHTDGTARTGLLRTDHGAFTKAYLHHLMKRGEILGLQLASRQNLTFYHWLMREARRAINEQRFESWRREIQPRVSCRL